MSENLSKVYVSNCFSNEKDDEYKLIVDYIKKNYKNIIIRDASLESEDIIYDEDKTPKVVLYQNIKSNMRIKTNCPVLILSYNSDVYVEYIYDNTLNKDTVKSETAKSGEFNSPLMKYPITDLINNKELLGTSLECTESSNVKMMTVENDVVPNGNNNSSVRVSSNPQNSEFINNHSLNNIPFNSKLIPPTTPISTPTAISEPSTIIMLQNDKTSSTALI
jgi:hypothetical protein